MNGFRSISNIQDDSQKYHSRYQLRFSLMKRMNLHLCRSALLAVILIAISSNKASAQVEVSLGDTSLIIFGDVDCLLPFKYQILENIPEELKHYKQADSIKTETSFYARVTPFYDSLGLRYDSQCTRFNKCLVIYGNDRHYGSAIALFDVEDDVMKRTWLSSEFAGNPALCYILFRDLNLDNVNEVIIGLNVFGRVDENVYIFSYLDGKFKSLYGSDKVDKYSEFCCHVDIETTDTGTVIRVVTPENELKTYYLEKGSTEISLVNRIKPTNRKE